MRPRRRLGTYLALVGAAGMLWWGLGRTPSPEPTAVQSTTTLGVPVIMRTPGGRLEVATVKAVERFTRADTAQFWGIDLGTTVSTIQATVIYRYHIPLATEWSHRIRGRTCIVRAPAPQPSLPVAFDSSTLEKYTRSGWARFNKQDNLATLERSISPELASRAASDTYRRLAADAARQTVREFVTQWLLREQAWQRDPDYRVVVLFPGETESAGGPL